VLDEEVALDAVHLDVDAAALGSGVYFERCVEHAACASPQIFECAQCSSCGATDIVEPCLQSIEFFDDGERYDNFASGERGET
jgi:hypothetical protein